MKKSKIIFSIILILISLVLAVVLYFNLPDLIVMQITISGAKGTTMPKLLGVAIPLVLSGIFSVLFSIKNEGWFKYLLLYIFSLLLYLLIFVMNINV